MRLTSLGLFSTCTTLFVLVATVYWRFEHSVEVLGYLLCLLTCLCLGAIAGVVGLMCDIIRPPSRVSAHPPAHGVASNTVPLQTSHLAHGTPILCSHNPGTDVMSVSSTHRTIATWTAPLTLTPQHASPTSGNVSNTTALSSPAVPESPPRAVGQPDAEGFYDAMSATKASVGCQATYLWVAHRGKQEKAQTVKGREEVQDPTVPTPSPQRQQRPPSKDKRRSTREGGIGADVRRHSKIADMAAYFLPFLAKQLGVKKLKDLPNTLTGLAKAVANQDKTDTKTDNKHKPASPPKQTTQPQPAPAAAGTDTATAKKPAVAKPKNGIPPRPKGKLPPPPPPRGKGPPIKKASAASSGALVKAKSAGGAALPLGKKLHVTSIPDDRLEKSLFKETALDETKLRMVLDMDALRSVFRPDPPAKRQETKPHHIAEKDRTQPQKKKILTDGRAQNLFITVRRLTYKPGILCNQILLPLKIPLKLDAIAPTMPTPLAILTQPNHTPPPQAALPEVSESLRCSGSVVSFGAPSNRGSEQREGDRELGLLLYRLRDMVCGEGERKAFEQLKRGLAEDIERLNQAFLCQEEITALRAYEGPLNELREMEQELLPFAYVERPQARISVLEIALTVEPRCAEVLKEIQRLQEACKQLLSSDSLKQLCHFCLHLINCINGHTGTQAKAPSDTNHPFGPSRALPPSSIPRPPFTAKSKLPPPPPKVRPPNHSARKSPPTPREELPTRIPGPSATTKAKNGGGAASTAINGGREVHGGIRGFHLGDLKKLADYKDKRGSTKVTLLHAVVCALTEVAYQREGGKGIDTKWQQQQQHNVDQADVYSDMDASPSSSRFGWTPQRKAELPFPPFVTKLKEELGTLRLVTRGLGEDIDGRLLELKQSLKFLEKEISMHARSYRPTAVNLSPTQITSTPPPVIPMHQPVFHQQSKTPAFGEQSATPRSPPMSIRIVEAPKDPESPTRLAKPAVSPSPSPDLLSPIPPKPTNQQLSGAEAISPDALSPLRQPSPSPLQKMAAMSREAAAMAAKIKSPRDSMQSVASMASAMSGGSADGGLLEIIEEGEGEMEGITKREKNALDRLIELHDYVSGQLSEITLQYDGVVKACRRVLEWCAEEEPSDIALPHPPPKATAPTEGGNGGPETTGGGARDEKKETKITKKNLQVLDSASRLIIMTTDLIKAFESAWRDVIRSPASYESLVPTAGFIRLLKLPSPPPARARLSRTPRTAIKRPARELTPQTARPLFGDRCSNNSVEDRFPVPFALPLAQQQESPAIRVDGAGDIDEHPSPEVPSKSRRVSFGPSKIPLLDLTRLSAAEAAKGGQVDGGGDEAAKLRMSVPSLVQAFNRGAALRPPNAFASRIPVRVTPRDESRRAPLQMSPPPQVFNIAASDTDQGREELPEWKDHFWSPSGNPSAAASASASASASYPASRTVSHMESEVSGHMESEVSAEDPDAAEAD